MLSAFRSGSAVVLLCASGAMAQDEAAPLCEALQTAVAAARDDRMPSLAAAGAAQWEPAALARIAPPFEDCAQAVEGFALCSVNSQPDGFVWTLSRPQTAGDALSAAQGLATSVAACFADGALEVSAPPWPAAVSVQVRESWLTENGAVRLVVLGEVYNDEMGAVSLTVAQRDAEQEAARATLATLD